MKVSKIILSCIFVLSLCACTKEEVQTQPETIDTKDIRGYINYSAYTNKYLSSNGSVEFYKDFHGYADFYDISNIHTVNVGTLTVGNIKVEANTDTTPNIYSYEFYCLAYMNEPSVPNANISQCGRIVPFGISGKNSYEAASGTLYIPKEIYVENGNSNDTLVIKTSQLPYRINWNKDEMNKNGVKVSVRAQAMFDRGFIQDSEKLVPDIGYCDISANDLSGLKQGQTFFVYLQRTNNGYMKSGNKVIRLSALVYTTQDYILN